MDPTPDHPTADPSSHSAPPRWLSLVLAFCLGCLVTALFFHPALRSSFDQTAAATLSPSPTPTPTPTPAPTPEPTPEPDFSQPIPEGEPVDQEEWFSDAVFIGDSRTDGFKLFSGVTPQADFLDHTGITVYEVANGSKVIRRDGKKLSILDALAEKPYGKVYVSLGVNELGYGDADRFAETYGQVIDAIRDCQPDALLYIQAIIPVNTAKCKAYDQRQYVTNERIAAYNEALFALCGEKKVPLIGIPDPLLDDTGEVSADLSADGVHFKREGYALWLDYLTAHTGSPL